ncbi:MAG: NAD(P)-binding protein [Candidatus Obscuribacterales bacterium]|nr:NAD(P)-binding protein [Candidatus Obscuribacterales bacterium]
MTSQAQELLSKFELPAMPRTFQLGCTAKLLNIHAQQRRAFNLVWALSQTKDVLNKDIAVIGAGIGGLTAALGLAAVGANVTVFERTGQAAHIQRGNLVRYVHPNISTWPDTGAGYPLTHLPFMNWRADLAGNVSDSLTRQWDAGYSVFKSKIRSEHGQVKFGGEVTAIQPVSRGLKWEVTDTVFGATDFDFVVLAVGYGLEKTHIVATCSYWRNDDLAQPVLGSRVKKKFVISGAGDGALIEVLRLKLKNFQHKQFFERIMFAPWLIHAEERFRSNPDWSSLWTGSSNIRQDYKDFFSELREDTEVVLNSRRLWHESDAQILHKLLVSLLIAAGELTCKLGELKKVSPPGSGSWPLTAYDKNCQVIDYAHAVLQRQGAQSELETLCFAGKSKEYEALKATGALNDSGGSITYEPKYEAGFLADEFMRAHFEQRYEVGFALVHRNESFKLADKIFHKLKKLDDSFAAPDIGQLLSSAVSFDWKGRAAILRLEIKELIEHGGGVTQRGNTPFRQFMPRQVFCLILDTNHKSLLDNLLDDTCLPYHFYSPVWSEEFPKDVPVDDLVNTDAHVFLVRRQDRFEVHCLPGMHQAHQLLRIPTILEIMGNSWSNQRLGGMGWAVQNLYEVNRTHIRGNEILR